MLLAIKKKSITMHDDTNVNTHTHTHTHIYIYIYIYIYTRDKLMSTTQALCKETVRNLITLCEDNVPKEGHN
jgi:hypothetical protein